MAQRNQANNQMFRKFWLASALAVISALPSAAEAQISAFLLCTDGDLDVWTAKQSFGYSMIPAGTTPAGGLGSSAAQMQLEEKFTLDATNCFIQGGMGSYLLTEIYPYGPTYNVHEGNVYVSLTGWSTCCSPGDTVEPADPTEVDELPSLPPT